jgi:hypothetical protein
VGYAILDGGLLNLVPADASLLEQLERVTPPDR